MQTVLVVDDCKDTCDCLSIILMANGYTVLLAYTLQEALEVVYTQKVDVLLTDLILGKGMMGSELPALMGKHLPKAAILISGKATNLPKYEGFHDYLMKPVSVELLCKTITSCLSLDQPEAKVA